MKLYEADMLSNKVSEINATRVTGAFYYKLDNNGKEQKNSLESRLHKCFESNDEAINLLRSVVKKRVQTAKETVAYYERELQQFTEKYPEHEK